MSERPIQLLILHGDERVRAVIPETASPTCTCAIASDWPALAMAVRRAPPTAVAVVDPYSRCGTTEQAWSKLKTLLRTAAARTPEPLESALAAVLDCITAAPGIGNLLVLNWAQLPLPHGATHDLYLSPQENRPAKLGLCRFFYDSLVTYSCTQIQLRF